MYQQPSDRIHGQQRNNGVDALAQNAGTRAMAVPETRQKVIEILSNTANGCIAEQGYHPGLLAHVKELENLNNTWQNENVKLYQDNQHLLRLLQSQNERLKLMNANLSNADQLNKITELQAEVSKLKFERDELLSTIQKNQRAEPGQDQLNITKLTNERRNFLDLYRIAYYEIQRLKAMLQKYAVLVSPSQQNATLDQQASLPTPPSAGPVPIPVSQMQPLSQFSTKQRDQATATSPANTSSFPRVPQNQDKRNELMQTQNSFHQGQQQTVMLHRTSGTFIAPSMQSPQSISPTTQAIPPVDVHSRQRKQRIPMIPNILSISSADGLNGMPNASPGIPPSAPTRPSLAPLMTTTPIQSDQFPNDKPVVTPVASQSSTTSFPYGSPEVSVNGPGKSKETGMDSTNRSSSIIRSISTSSPEPLSASLKRQNQLLSEDSRNATEEPYKKPRLDLEQVEVGTEAKSDEEEEIELGPDGLRLVKDCLEQLFGDTISGQVTCKLCESRHMKGFLPERTAPFINATDEQLEAHCIAEHMEAWNTLRNGFM